jgi:RND superfamily putative drug exporter
MRVVLTMVSRVVIAVPKRVLFVVILLTVAAIFGAHVAEHLGAGGFQDPSSQSAREVKVLTKKFCLGNMDLTLVVRSRAACSSRRRQKPAAAWSTKCATPRISAASCALG